MSLGRRLVPHGFFALPVIVVGGRPMDLRWFASARAFYPWTESVWLDGPPTERMTPIEELDEFSAIDGYDDDSTDEWSAI